MRHYFQRLYLTVDGDESACGQSHSLANWVVKVIHTITN